MGDINKGLRNDFRAAMEEIEQENMDALMKQEKKKDNRTLKIADDGTTMDTLQDMAKTLNTGNETHDCDVISKTMKFLICCWAKELNAVPLEKKKTVQWKTQSAIHR